jgi:hypothetical protein
MNDNAALLELNDLHLLDEELGDATGQGRLRKLGLVMDRPPLLERERQRLDAAIDRRWMYHYQRARGRYGRGVAVVHDRVCQGCHVTLPTALSPASRGALTLCESCGRILYWG